MLVLAVAPLAFIAAINPSLNAATVTAVIVLLVPTMHHANPLDSAIDRVLEVTVGALTGLLVSFLVLPSRAHQPDPRQRGARARTDRGGAVRIAGGPDARSRQRRAAPDPGRHRRGAGRPERDRRGSRARARGASVVRPRHRSVAADHPAAAPRRRDDRPRQRGAAAGRICRRGWRGRWPRSARRSYAICARLPLRCAAAAAGRHPAGRRRAAGLCRRSRGGAQRRPDARPARRRGGALLRAGIFAGADAAESERSRPLPSATGAEAQMPNRPVRSR